MRQSLAPCPLEHPIHVAEDVGDARVGHPVAFQELGERRSLDSVADQREGVVADPPPLDHLRDVGMAEGGEEVGVGRELGDGLSLGDVGGGLHDGDQNIPTVLFALPDV